MIMIVNRIEIIICVKSCLNDMFIYGKVCVYCCLIFLVYYMLKCVFECWKFFFIILKINRICIVVCFVRFVRYNNICIDECLKYVLFIENGICSVYCVDVNFFFVNLSVGKICINFEICINEIMLMNGINICIIDCFRKIYVIIKDVCINISECLELYVL